MTAPAGTLPRVVLRYTARFVVGLHAVQGTPPQVVIVETSRSWSASR